MDLSRLDGVLGTLALPLVLVSRLERDNRVPPGYRRLALAFWRWALSRGCEERLCDRSQNLHSKSRRSRPGYNVSSAVILFIGFVELPNEPCKLERVRNGDIVPGE
jgi:hypothetical protein